MTVTFFFPSKKKKNYLCVCVCMYVAHMIYRLVVD